MTMNCWEPPDDADESARELFVIYAAFAAIVITGCVLAWLLA